VTPQKLEEIRRKPHGPDVDLLIEEVERCWALLVAVQEKAQDIAHKMGDYLDQHAVKRARG